MQGTAFRLAQRADSELYNFTRRKISCGKAYFCLRDIKGANILVDPRGRIKHADFGMAKHVGFNFHH